MSAANATSNINSATAGSVAGLCLLLMAGAVSEQNAEARAPMELFVDSGPLAEVAAPRRETYTFGALGDAPLTPAIGSADIVRKGDALAALSSDAAHADAAYLPPMRLSASPPSTEVGEAAARIAQLKAAEAAIVAPEPVETMDEAERAIAQELGIGAPRGVNYLARPSATAELSCLAEAVYFEARGEPLEGQAAVVEVVLNRVDAPYWPDTICGVVNQGSERATGCQFSYTCDGLPETVTDRRAWAQAETLARLYMSGAPRGITDRATHYHADFVSPRWARTMERTAVVGDHIFYRRVLRFSKRAGG